MARYKIDITINSEPNNGDMLVFNDQNTAFIFRFVDIVEWPNDVEISSNTASVAARLYNVFSNVHNKQGKYILNWIGNIVTIEGEFVAEPLLIQNDANVGYMVIPTSTPLSITSTNFLTNIIDSCNLIDVQINASVDFTKLNSPRSETFPATTQYLVTGIQRNDNVNFQIENDSNETSSITKQMPSYLNAGLISISVIGNSVTILDTTFGLILEYSLDDISWQFTASFPNLNNGDYTVYVRDNFGCKTNTTFTIDVGEDGTVTVPDPYFFYSDANPLVMAKREQWDDIGVFRNDRNLLSCESTDRVVHIEKQRWRETDSIYLQFKNNYSDLKITTSDDDQVWPLSQKSNNMNLKEAMDCKVISLSATTVGIYFIAGQTYDYDTLAPLSDYTLNGQLPAWAIQGNIITIAGSNYTIIETIPNEVLELEQIVINASIPSGDYVVKAIFNSFVFDVFEVVIPLNNKVNFNVLIEYDGQLQYSSELVYVDNYSLNLLRIEYYMDYNTDMFFATGIRPVIRLQQDLSNAINKGDRDKYETDNDSIQVDSSNYVVNVYKFLPVTKQLARKVMTILASSNINIMGIDYTTDDTSIEALEESNLYIITATMSERNNNQSRDTSGSVSITLPALVESDSGFIKI